MTFAMSDVKKKILERSGFRVHVRKVMNDVKELINKGDVESVRLKLKSQKINLEKHQKEIASLDQEIAELGTGHKVPGGGGLEKFIFTKASFV